MTIKGFLSRGLPAIAAAVFALAVSAPAFSSDFPAPPPEPSSAHGTRTAVLAGGCFWGMEGVFERLKGVIEVTSGYAGGEKNTAHYELVGTGTTGHAESVQITYDPAAISYGTLLRVYFSVAHDPTQFNFQGPDHGSQYRSAIFYASPEQQRTAEQYIKILTEAKVFGKSIVTQVVPLKAFYPAEDYHQHFMDRNPDYPYIVFWDKPKVIHLEKEYPELLARR
jgi:peptide-methionine (S)-S-oxide reductase